MRRTLRPLIRTLVALALVLGAVGVVGSPASATSYNYGPRYATVASYSTNVVEDPADIYYPAPAGLLTGTQTFPVAFLMQGALVDKSLYSQYAQRVASYGFIVVVTNNFNVVFGQTGNYQQELSLNEVQVWMNLENANPLSILKGHIDVNSLTVLGHSFGGAASLFAVGNQCQIPFCYGVYVRPTNLRAAALWGSNTVTPEDQQYPPLTQPVAAIDEAGVPIALLNGTADGNATPANAQATHDLITGGSHALVSLTGANHYGVTNIQNPPGCVPDTSAQTISQSTSIEEIGRWSALWLLAQLGDATAHHYVYDGVGDNQDHRVSVQLAG